MRGAWPTSPARSSSAQPGSKPKRGTVSGTRKVRESKSPKARPSVARLGKRRGAVIDAVEADGGSCTLAELCGILHIARTRDLVRRKRTAKGRDGLLVWLEEAGILAVEGDLVTLADNWLDRLEEAREAGEELEPRSWPSAVVTIGAAPTTTATRSLSRSRALPEYGP